MATPRGSRAARAGADTGLGLAHGGAAGVYCAIVRINVAFVVVVLITHCTLSNSFGIGTLGRDWDPQSDTALTISIGRMEYTLSNLQHALQHSFEGHQQFLEQLLTLDFLSLLALLPELAWLAHLGDH